MSGTARPSAEVAGSVVAAVLNEAVAHSIDTDAARALLVDCGLRANSTEVGRADAALDVSAPIGWSIGVAHESAEGAVDRKARGAFYTPLSLATGLVRVAFDRIEPRAGLRVVDPTCGAGAFLLAAAEFLHDAGVEADSIGEALFGFDVEPLAVAACQAALGLWLLGHGGPPSGPTIAVADVIHEASPRATDDGFDIVVGNPPFLNQLRSASVRSEAQRDELGAKRGYADAAALALERGVSWLRPGGRLVLIQPRSTLAARDAATLRDAVPGLSGLWIDDANAFAASVQVCAPVIDRVESETIVGASKTLTPSEVELFSGLGVDKIGSSSDPTWSGVLADSEGVPRLRNVESQGVLEDVASVTADFRQWFYDVAGLIEDAPGGNDAVTAVRVADQSELLFHPVYTSGLIDANDSLWGRRSARIGGRRWERPALSAQAVAALGADSRLAPKVLIANQTRVIEAVADIDGRCLAITPVITALASPADVCRVLAVLCAPNSTILMRRWAAGSGLSRGAIRLSATRVGQLPLPRGDAAWNEAAELLRGSHSELDPHVRRRALVEAGRAMHEAFGTLDERALDWWLAQLPEIKF